MKTIPNSNMGYVFALLVVLLLLGLPIAVWLDLSKLVETNLIQSLAASVITMPTTLSVASSLRLE
jgi:hypothetical protein